MNKAILFSLLSFIIFHGNAQNSTPKIITLPENLSSKDFSFLKDELKNAQVVLLGENTHFDGNVFEIKTEIIKFLHKELDFSTIAFESGIYDVWKAQQNINNGEKTKIAIEKSLFSIWSKTKEFQSFIPFFEDNKNKLKIVGFDSQITAEYGNAHLIKDLVEYCKLNQFKLNFKQDDLELLLESIINSGVFDEEDISYEKFKFELNNLITHIDKKPKNEFHFYWKQIIKSLLSIGEESYIKNEPIASAFYTSLDDNIRDKQMANNLLSYIKEHPNEKIICWGANVHFANDLSSVKTPIIKEFIPMGSYLKKELQDKIYSLAVVTSTDSIFLNNVWSKTPINPKSFEYFLKTQNKPYLFVSSQQDEMKKTQLNRLFSPINFIDARLDLLHDGYLYFNEVKPSTPIEENDHKLKANDLTNASLNKSVKANTLNKTDEQQSQINTLENVVVYSYSKKYIYSIIEKTIENINKNYPSNPFNSIQYSNVTVKVQNETTSDLEFINDQYDRGYNQIDRNSKQLKEIRWNIKNEFIPTSIRQFWSLSYNNPIMYSRFLNNRKSKKFVYKLNEIKLHNNQNVYVIDFSIPRNHFTYTQRGNPSVYSGTLLINKDDFAIVKIIENWDFVENTENSKYEIFGWDKKYSKKEIESETLESVFEKINDLYFLTSSEIELYGKLYTSVQTTTPLKINISSTWKNFNTESPTKITYKEEINLFEKIKYNEKFWESYDASK
jgi:erythromycin esterase-like protein